MKDLPVNINTKTGKTPNKTPHPKQPSAQRRVSLCPGWACSQLISSSLSFPQCPLSDVPQPGLLAPSAWVGFAMPSLVCRALMTKSRHTSSPLRGDLPSSLPDQGCSGALGRGQSHCEGMSPWGCGRGAPKGVSACPLCPPSSPLPTAPGAGHWWNVMNCSPSPRSAPCTRRRACRRAGSSLRSRLRSGPASTSESCVALLAPGLVSTHPFLEGRGVVGRACLGQKQIGLLDMGDYSFWVPGFFM